MSNNQYRVETTKAVLYVWAKDKETAIQMVMDEELCPRRSILHVMMTARSKTEKGA